ncbi:hypothetical protein [Amycolatopsis sp. cg13]|uniref:hypothetical protein n=1 Tax=Amycolatopsis sp. cg13 TaxID=3238807 RepID=UPI00352686F1
MSESTRKEPAKGPVAPAGKECFVICPIGPAGSDTRKRSDQILKHIISPCVEPLGYSVSRADTIDQSGLITTQIIDRLINVDLVIADLTDQNPNVFYELAVRHAANKPFVHLISSGQTIPFDIQGLRTVFLDHTDLDSVHEAKQQLAGMVNAIDSGAPVETPITYTVDLQQLRQSDNPDAKGIADLIEDVQAIKRAMMQTGARVPRSFQAELVNLRKFVEHLAKSGRLEWEDTSRLSVDGASRSYDEWLSGLAKTLSPWDGPRKVRNRLDDEPPF